MTNEKDKARLTCIAKQWAATLVGSRHVSSSEVATLAEILEPLLVTVRRETEQAVREKVIGMVAVLPAQGTMNYRRGYEEGVRDAIRTLEAAAREGTLR